jgi:hypothetical protein
MSVAPVAMARQNATTLERPSFLIAGCPSPSDVVTHEWLRAASGGGSHEESKSGRRHLQPLSKLANESAAINISSIVKNKWYVMLAKTRKG